ncbi:MAG TPA: bifunctional precorrin-2 dehydrogenase/sirohydrochlorin ferrochelatase [Vicinamibacterales bacterium]|nr:bifunctional precorrin-2 dehydrogenase/sirohydrochlorin ferrochelatase [Vicinamibacterales bacterium]
MELFPLFLKLAGRRVVLVGSGPVAASKVDALVRAGADLRTVEPDDFEPADLDGAWLVVAAAPAEVNRRVAEAAETRQVFVNAVDDPPNASAYLGGVIRRSGVTIAISTSGEAPALAGVLREGIDALLPPDLERWTACAREQRAAWKADGVPMEDRRPRLIEALKELYP